MAGRKSERSTADPWPALLSLLTRRDYATAELRGRLLTQGFAPAAVEVAIARAIELGYLDDARYAEHLSRALVTSGRAAGPRLTLELRRRGLPDELVAAATAAARAEGGEDTALRDLIARRFPDFVFSDADAGSRRRVIHFLQRRGFALDRILTELKRTDS